MRKVSIWWFLAYRESGGHGVGLGVALSQLVQRECQRTHRHNFHDTGVDLERHETLCVRHCVPNEHLQLALARRIVTQIYQIRVRRVSYRPMESHVKYCEFAFCIYNTL